MFASVSLARTINEFVEAAGKEASARRNRARQAIRFAVEFFRQRLRVASGLEPGGDADLRRAVSRTPSPADPEQLAAILGEASKRCDHVDRNAHQATLIDAWLDDVATGRGLPVAG